MKRIFFTIFSILLLISNLEANPIDRKTAYRAGATFAKNSLPAMRGLDQMELVKSTESYYVFNVGQTGFVIISADDSFRPVVGYSDEGAFPTENPSPEMMYYLDNLSQGRQAALRAAIVTDELVREEWDALLNGEQLAPRNDLRSSFFLVQTRWNQGSPYNKFCPKAEGEGRAYAGCVATAMSQVMNYWRYPSHGYGQHSYVHYKYGELSADFAAAEYDFDMMPNGISDMSPAENVDPIAMFMYHCGIAVDMGYDPSGSGAYSEDVPEAVLKYFGYTNRCRIHYRDAYSLKEFQDMLKDQFELGWPCYYSGQDTDGSGGHAFVCDGYDENDLFHFNWGWSGSGDGFFVIDELNVSGYAFNDSQSVLTNFVPAEVFLHTAKAPDYFKAEPLGDDDFSVALSWVNPSTTLDGRPLETIDQIVVMRDGKEIFVADNPVPGEAMSLVDVTHLPLTVDYSINVICQGSRGRRAFFRGVNLGPSCPWTARFSASQEEGWGDGELMVLNASGVAVARLTAERGEQEFEFDVPQGRLSFLWTAPADSLDIGISIFDTDGETVFAYQGPSSLMPSGLFYEVVNTCGGAGITEAPSDLQARVDGEDVVLQWKGVADPGYGYNIYRDGVFYSMSSDPSFTDVGAASNLHNYFVTVFAKEGESDPTNTVDAVSETPDRAPRNLDYEVMDNGKVRLTWSAPEQPEGLAGYQVFRKAIGEEYHLVKSCGANTTAYTITNLPDGNRYDFKVVAAFNRDYDWSSPARSLRKPDLHYVELNRTHIPEGLMLEPSDGQLLLRWEAPMLAETYNVYCNGEQIATGLLELYYSDTLRGDALMYQVTGVLNGVESSPSNKAVYGNYAVGENPQVEVTLFPNPANDRVTIQGEGLQEIVVFDLAGRQLMRHALDGNEVSLDLGCLNQGVYFFRVSAEKGCLLQKVVLVK